MHTQQQAFVPQVDLLTQVACMFDPMQYCEEQDPLLLGVDVSDDSSGKESTSQSPETSTESSGEDMEGIQESRHGKKRAWEDRWETAEGRDEAKEDDQTQEEEAGDLEKSTEDKQAVEKSKRFLKSNTRLLEATVEANRQIELQERMQIQQDKEHEMVRAAMELEANIQGHAQVRLESNPPSRPKPNPRLDLAAARRQAIAPSEGGPSDGEEWETAGKRGRKKGKGHGRRSASRSTSRTPRGKAEGQDTMD